MPPPSAHAWDIPIDLQPFAKRLALPNPGGELFYYDSGGDKPPLLLLHGLADEADTWRHVFAPLSADWRVIAPDLPGFGRSAKPRQRYTLDVFQRGVLALLDHLGIDRTHWVGSSMGAMISHYTALTHPQRVRSLMLIDGTLIITQRPTTLKGKLMAALQLAPGFGEYWYTKLRGRPDEAFATLRAYYGDFDALPQADRDFLYRRVQQRVWDDAQRYSFFSTRRAMTGWFVSQTNLAARVAAITVPTMLLWGDRDAILNTSNAEATIRVQKSARLHVLPGIGHLPQQEAPALVLQALREHLAG